MSYITKNLTPRQINPLIEGLTATAGEGEDPASADAEALAGYIEELRAWARDILSPAVQGIIEVHQATGIDLKHWEPVLRLVQSADPTFSIENEPEW